jgi:hypothetical protein
MRFSVSARTESTKAQERKTTMRKLLLVIASLIALQLPGTTFAQEPTALATVESFKEAGFPIGEIVAYDENTPRYLIGRPGEMIEKVVWHDTRLERRTDTDGLLSLDAGGSIERFRNPSELQTRLRYIEAFDGTILATQDYRYALGNLLLRLPFALTPRQAEEYAAFFGVS